MDLPYDLCAQQWNRQNKIKMAHEHLNKQISKLGSHG